MKQEEKEQINETYNDYVESVTPKANLWLRMAKAFLVGGLICLLGQCIINIGKKYGLDDQTAASYCSLTLVFLSALLTGTGIYPVIASFGGAGALVPITGFANSVAATAMVLRLKDMSLVSVPGSFRSRTGDPVWDFFVLDPWFDLLVYDDTWYVIEKIP